MVCVHEFWERESAVETEGYCPLCMDDQIAALRQTNLSLKRMLWMVLKSNGGYTLECQDAQDYPGDDNAVIKTREDTVTQSIHLSATING